MCLRDCPDACGLLVEVEDVEVKALRGDPDHPVTRGFLCRRTKRDFPSLLRRADRIVRPRLRTPAGFRDVGWDEALDLCAERMRATIAEHGPEAIFFLHSGGNMGLVGEACRAMFDALGATGVRGGICLDAGEWAQVTDFGAERVSDWRTLDGAAAIVLWGRNVHTASPHLLPLVRKARARGAEVVLIDPLPTDSRALATRFIQPRPGRDAALALGVARVLFEEGGVDPAAGAFCDGLDGFRALAFRRTVAEAAAIADVPEEAIRALGRLYGRTRPVATWIGGGLQRWVDGAETVRAIDGLCAVAGHVGVRGGGAFYETPRRRDLALAPGKARRTIRNALLGRDLAATRDPPIRVGWIQRANPVASFPDSLAIERALRSLDFLVVVDPFPTDTAACAHLVLPPTMMLEHDDLVGSYGHHQLGLARRVVAPPGEARTDLEIAQGLGRRLGVEEAVAGDATQWIDRMLAPLGLRRESLEAGTVGRPGEQEVAWEGRRFGTPSGRANLITELAPRWEAPDTAAADHPLHLLTVAPIAWQASQVPPEDQRDLPAVIVHPEAPGVAGRADGDEVSVRTAVGALRARLRLDPAMRRDTAVMFRGGWVRFGHGVNALVGARESANGGQAAYFDERARLE